MVAPNLTPKQKQILDYLTHYREKHGYAPSQHEIAKHFGFKSLGTVQNYLVRLERQGVLQKTWNARRGMQVLPPSQPQRTSSAVAVPLPLLGRVAAGRPIEAITTDETLEVPSSLRGDFVLKVTGDSMIEDGILDGDYVIIQKQSTAESGQTVVALIHNEATIKRYHPRGGRVELHAANPAYKPIIVERGDFRIEGVLKGVLRLCK